MSDSNESTVDAMKRAIISSQSTRITTLTAELAALAADGGA